MSAYKIKKHVKSAWISSSPKIKNKKPWGYELVWSGFQGVHGKTLFIESGKRTSFKFHKMKTEVLFLRTGTAEVVFGDELSMSDPIGHPMTVKKMSKGESLLVQSGCPYRIKAITDCEFFEIGDKATDIPVRIEDDYGRQDKEYEK